MRSCAFRIFEAATISIALVILRVFCTLLILVRISLEPGILASPLEPQSLSVSGRPGTGVCRERNIPRPVSIHIKTARLWEKRPPPWETSTWIPDRTYRRVRNDVG